MTRQVVNLRFFQKCITYFEVCVSPQSTEMDIFMKDVHDQHITAAHLQEMSENIREVFCIHTVGEFKVLYKRSV
jgi:two-component system sporulation sensor kinase A